MTKLIRRRVMLERCGLSSTTQWRLERDGAFPARVRLTEGGSVGWFEAEVDRWVRERIRGGGKRPPLADRDERA